MYTTNDEMVTNCAFSITFDRNTTESCDFHHWKEKMKTHRFVCYRLFWTGFCNPRRWFWPPETIGKLRKSVVSCRKAPKIDGKGSSFPDRKIVVFYGDFQPFLTRKDRILVGRHWKNSKISRSGILLSYNSRKQPVPNRAVSSRKIFNWIFE